MAPAPDQRAGARRVLLFLLLLLLVWTPLQLFVWPGLQPWYSARVAGTASLLLGVIERGERITTLRPDGAVVHIESGLNENTNEPVMSVSADLLHFYVVLVVSLVLVWPGLPIRRRLALLAVSVTGLFLYHVIVILIKIEHVYAVALAEVSLRNYSDAERWFWEWLHDSTIFLGIPIIPAVALVTLFAASGFGEEARTQANRKPPTAGRSAMGPRGPTRRWGTVAALLGAVLIAASAGACITHGPRIAARQSEKRCMLGYRALAEGDIPGALKLFEGAIALNPRFSDSYLGKGDALTAAGRTSEATEAYRAAIDRAPDRAVTHFKLGNALLALKDPQGALTAFQDTLALEPNLREARINLALTLGRLGRPAESEGVLREALGSHPDDREALLQLSALLIAGQRACEALPHLQRLRVLGPPAGREALVEESVAELQRTCP